MKTLKQTIKEALKIREPHFTGNFTSGNFKLGLGPFTIRDKSRSHLLDIQSDIENVTGRECNVEGPEEGWWEIFSEYTDVYNPRFVEVLCACAENYGDGKIYNIGFFGFPYSEIKSWVSSHGYDALEIDIIGRTENMFQLFDGVSTDDFRELVARFCGH